MYCRVQGVGCRVHGVRRGITGVTQRNLSVRLLLFLLHYYEAWS